MSKAFVSLMGDGYRTTITSRHHVYHIDEPVEDGGQDSAAKPTEVVMGALGSCIAITMKLYAERKGWALTGVEIDLDFERFNAKDYPAAQSEEGIVHEIRKGIRLHGDLTDEQKERILEIGGKCPVHRLIASPSFFVERWLEDELQSE